MPWQIDNDKLYIIGEKHFSDDELKELINKLKEQEPHRSQSICTILENFLYDDTLHKSHIQQLTKWCSWSHKKAEKTAQEIFSMLFYGTKLDRLLDQQGNKKPSEKEADEKYSNWTKKLYDIQKKLETELYEDTKTAKEVFENVETDKIDDLLKMLDEKMKEKSFVRKKTIIDKILRTDYKIIRLIKEKYKQCQFPNCDANIIMKNGKNYVEVAHIIPVHKGGRSTLGNLLVLCPNHHKEFDLGELEISENENKSIIGKLNGKKFQIDKINLNNDI